jgi:predicted alpha/beta-fold hydrolase
MRNAHLNTIVGGKLRRIAMPAWDRERISTPDDDFLDIDWSRVGSDRVVVLSHGLEGCTNRPYIAGMTRALNRAGIDVAAWNYRGCSGEPNRRLRFYHSGETGDLRTVIGHVAPQYDRIGLVGFSLGGNITLKYLGEVGDEALVDGGVGLSVPCDLTGSSRQIERRENRVYLKRFMTSLRAKIRQKAEQYPGKLSLTGLDDIRTFREFDDRYTAPLHGFRDAEDYWVKASSAPFLDDIRVPALMLNALDDSFLSPSCYPGTSNPVVHIETPRYGGHIGFVRRGVYWSEHRTLAFFERLWPETTMSM